MPNSITHASLPYPIRKARYSVEMGFVVSAGTLADPTTPDTEISVNGGASFSDAAEEITTGGGNGAGYLTLTGAELDNPSVIIAFKSANCVTRLKTLRPRNLAIVGSGTLSAGSAGGGTLGTLLAYDLTGCFIRTTGGTGGGGTGGANNQARRIITYNTSTGAFTVSPDWETTPDNTTTYDVLLPEGVTLGMLQTINPATPGRKPVVAADGLIDATTVKLGPTGSAVAQTAADIPGLIGALNAAAASGDPGTTTTLVQYLKQIVNTLEGSAGIPSFPAAADAANAVSIAEVVRQINARIVGTLASGTHSAQSGDAFARLGAPASTSISADIAGNATSLSTLLSRITASRAGYLDNLNVGGVVASQADINALNQSASRRVILTTVEQWERPDSGSSAYYIEARLFDADGAPVNADSTPTLTATGIITGNLSAQLSASTNPATGVYRWTYTVAAADSSEAVRSDLSAVISSQTFTMSVMSQVCDLASTDFTAADRTKLSAIFDKLPSKTYLTGTTNSDGDVQLNEATGTLQDVTLATSQPSYAPIKVGDAVTLASSQPNYAPIKVGDAVTLASSQPNYAPLKASDYKSPVAASGAVTAVTTQYEFQTNLTQVNSFWLDHPMRFTSGSNAGAVRAIAAYDQANGTIYLTNGDGFPATIQVGDTFEILSDHIHSVATIAGETATEVLGDTASWPTNSIGNRIQGSAQASALTTLSAIFTGMTSLPNWIRRLTRKDAGTAGMGTAQTEINTGGTSTFDGTTDSLEAVRDASGGGGGGPSAADLRAALGMASANLDSQLAALDTSIGQRAVPGSAMTLTTGERTTLETTVRTAIGLTTANLDSQLGALSTLVGQRATPGAAMTLTAGERTALETTVRTAVGLATANLDGQLSTLSTSVDQRAVPGSAMTLTSGERSTLSAELRSAIGLAAANLDAQLNALATLISQRAVPGSAMTLTTGERDAVGAAVMASGDIDGLTMTQVLRLASAVLLGQVSGASALGGTLRFDAVNGSKVRVTSVCDTNGNRESVTLDAT